MKITSQEAPGQYFLQGRQHFRSLEAPLGAGMQGLHGGGQLDPMQGNGFILHFLLSSFFIKTAVFCYKNSRFVCSLVMWSCLKLLWAFSEPPVGPTRGKGSRMWSSHSFRLLDKLLPVKWLVLKWSVNILLLTWRLALRQIRGANCPEMFVLWSG